MADQQSRADAEPIAHDVIYRKRATPTPELALHDIHLPQADGWSETWREPFQLDVPDHEADPAAAFLQHAGFDVAAVVTPMPSGDRIAAIAAGPGKILTVVLDVEGHGIEISPAACFLLRTFTESAQVGVTDPEALQRQLNAVAYAHCLRAGATVVFLEAGMIKAVGAGSPYPIVFPAQGRATILPAAGPTHGFSLSPEYDVVTRPLKAGETMALISDGVSEAGALSDNGNLFDVERRFGEILDPSSSLPSNLIRCVDAVRAWAPHDDVSVLLARVLPADRSEARVAVRHPTTPCLPARASFLNPREAAAEMLSLRYAHVRA